MLATFSPAGGAAAGRAAATGPAGLTVVAFAVVVVALMAWPAIDPGLGTFYDRTIAYQSDRDSPFSIWGQVPALAPLRTAILAAVGALAIAFAIWPKHKSPTQVAALSAALLIGLQLTAQHWFYLYIVWFYPLLLVAMATLERPTAVGPEVPREAALQSASSRGAAQHS
jgi:hypothetical protein